MPLTCKFLKLRHKFSTPALINVNENLKIEGVGSEYLSFSWSCLFSLEEPLRRKGKKQLSIQSSIVGAGERSWGQPQQRAGSSPKLAHVTTYTEQGITWEQEEVGEKKGQKIRLGFLRMSLKYIYFNFTWLKLSVCFVLILPWLKLVVRPLFIA